MVNHINFAMFGGNQYSSKMKCSAQIEPIGRTMREVRQSEPPWMYACSQPQCRNPLNTTSIQLNLSRELAGGGRSSRNSSRTHHTPQKKINSTNIERLVSQLKNEYGLEGRLSRNSNLTRAKSQHNFLPKQVNASHPNDKYKKSIDEMQEKLTQFSERKNPTEKQTKKSPLIPSKSERSLKLSSSPLSLSSKSPINEAKGGITQKTQQCRQLCQQIRRKLLKQTVSTTTTQRFQPKREPSINDFRVGRLIGEGKFSKVYLAWHLKTGVLLALKIIKKQTIRRQNFTEQLARQIKLQYFFSHVNLVKLYACFHDKQNVYLLLEYCPGGQLYDLFRIRSRLREDDWAPIMKGICQGLLELHSRGVIHRDLKPQNVVLAFGIPKIADFGWSVHAAGEKRQTFCGTPLYISPELLLGGSYERQVDIWALGVMTYQFLTGRIPFKIEHQKNLLEIVNSHIVYPKSLSKDCVNLLRMILEKDPQSRIAILDILQHPFLIRKPIYQNKTLS